MEEDMTIAEAAKDPLIAQVLKADGIPQRAFDQLLQSAARLRENELMRAVEAADEDEGKSDSH